MLQVLGSSSPTVRFIPRRAGMPLPLGLYHKAIATWVSNPTKFLKKNEKKLKRSF